MKKILAVVVLLASLAVLVACTDNGDIFIPATAQSQVLLNENNPANDVENTYIQCDSELLYVAFLDSDYWLLMWCPQCCGYFLPISNGDNWRISDKRLFDFDNDGVIDLWFRAVSGEEDFISPRWSSSITGFATIRDGEVFLLLNGFTTGGSIGGSFVTFGYDQENSEYVLVVSSFAGGFGGNYSGARIYSMQNGEVTRLYRIGYTHLWASHHGGEESHIFTVDGENVCYDVYAQIADRFLKY